MANYEEQAPKQEPETKTVKQPREKVRSIEECMELPVTKLTEKEKIKVIEELKGTNNMLAQQRQMYAENAEQAHNTVREFEKKFDEMESYYRNKLQFIDNQLTAFAQAVTQTLRGGM